MDLTVDSADAVISIGTVAEKLGVSVSSIRRYEEAGLVIALRTPSGHRLFSYEDLQRIEKIRRIIHDLGLNIEGIRRLQALLPCWELLPCSPEIRDKCPAYQSNDRPCWMVKKHAMVGGCVCRRCSVYRHGIKGILGIKQLVYGKKTDKGHTREKR